MMRLKVTFPHGKYSGYRHTITVSQVVVEQEANVAVTHKTANGIDADLLTSSTASLALISI